MTTRSLLAAAVLALSGVPTAMAQPTYNPMPPAMPAPYNSTTILSPYMNLLRGGDPAANFYLGVRPEQQRRYDMTLQTNTLGNTPGFVPTVDDRVYLDVGDKQLPGTGHPTGFMIYNAYYNLPNQRSFIPYNPRPNMQQMQQFQNR